MDYSFANKLTDLVILLTFLLDCGTQGSSGGGSDLAIPPWAIALILILLLLLLGLLALVLLKLLLMLLVSALDTIQCGEVSKLYNQKMNGQLLLM